MTTRRSSRSNSLRIILGNFALCRTRWSTSTDGSTLFRNYEAATCRYYHDAKVLTTAIDDLRADAKRICALAESRSSAGVAPSAPILLPASISLGGSEESEEAKVPKGHSKVAGPALDVVLADLPAQASDISEQPCIDQCVPEAHVRAMPPCPSGCAGDTTWDAEQGLADKHFCDTIRICVQVEVTKIQVDMQTRLKRRWRVRCRTAAPCRRKRRRSSPSSRSSWTRAGAATRKGWWLARRLCRT